ncbi:hypothetical protein GCM10010106_21400 [Thermopolyspora flexuosa]|uniref:Protein phosphatase 2C-like protein n=1 Tax=Thermopolyspora flexuosa TaxID=103836 RepID=A0A543J378_9ACTN|nr:integrase [Thermopolyspora flexuosa]TQM77279.1 hypothetical protein FHX40_4040 [Thermopolyspora flexuosa]GGM74638.1 hypothetical protein GCM10010106_21400 [Thermopolyspora flexuosa]
MHVSLATSAAPGRDNEDFVAATADAIVLLDGTGPAPGQGSGCSHGVPWYVRSLGSVLLSELSQPSCPLPQILSRAIKHVTSLHDFTCDLSRPGTPGASVVMMRRTRDAVDFLVLADAVVVVDVGAPEPLVIRDGRPGPDGNGVTRLYRPEGGPPVAEHAAAGRGGAGTRTLVGRDRRVACTDPLAAERAVTGSVPLEQVTAVALLSDGVSRLVDRFGFASWRQLLALLGRHGAWEAIRQVRAAEQADPTGERWPRDAVHDDASVAYWEPE